MHPLKNFVSYSLAHVANGCVSVTACETKAGTDESVKKARDWIAKNDPTINVGAIGIGGTGRLSSEIARSPRR
jgi:hypothetical protein